MCGIGQVKLVRPEENPVCGIGQVKVVLVRGGTTMQSYTICSSGGGEHRHRKHSPSRRHHRLGWGGVVYDDLGSGYPQLQRDQA